MSACSGAVFSPPFPRNGPTSPGGTVLSRNETGDVSTQSAPPTLLVLGCRGIPAAHGGFETFAERLSVTLAGRGWRVVVYCQENVARVDERFGSDRWNGVDRVLVRVSAPSPWDTFEFDWHSVRHAAREAGVCLVLGYNTGLFLLRLATKRRPILTNMDGIEWLRPKWSLPVRLWFFLNELVAARLSDKLVADHPAVAQHLAKLRSRRAISTIPYGGDPVWAAPTRPLEELGLEPRRYLIAIARIEPDNSIATIVRAFSRRPRGVKLAVLGRLDPEHRYHREVIEAASSEVVFPGAIYDKEAVQALRFHARAYCHGHTVGGTNPSLVEALWSGNAVIAHRNVYNLWTAGHEQFFFRDEDECDRTMSEVIADDAAVLRAGQAARHRAIASFEWDRIVDAYESELAALGRYAIAQDHDLREGGAHVRSAAE